MSHCFDAHTSKSHTVYFVVLGVFSIYSEKERNDQYDYNVEGREPSQYGEIRPNATVHGTLYHTEYSEYSVLYSVPVARISEASDNMRRTDVRQANDFEHM